MIYSSDVDRGRQRDRSIRHTLVASLGQQIAVVAVTLISLPFVTRVLTTEEYGVLATLTGFFALLGFADLGIGSAVTTRLASATGAVPAERPRPQPKPNEVLVKVHACGLNRADLGMSRGAAHGAAGGAGTVLGMEWAGEVVEMGAEIAVGISVMPEGRSPAKIQQRRQRRGREQIVTPGP